MNFAFWGFSEVRQEFISNSSPIASVRPLCDLAGLRSPAPLRKEVALMRRIVATVAVMALLLAAMAAPAFAVANIKANCVGEAASIFNQDEPGAGGQLVSEVAHEGDIGESASTNCEPRPPLASIHPSA